MTSSLSFRYEVGYRYNDLASVERALTEAEGDIAAIFVGGASYPYCGQIEMPTKEFAAGLRTLADAAGAMLVLDEIRTNFRVGKSVRGGHWSELAGPNATDGEMELLAPDMYCQCKALANGHPIAALLGGEAARDGAAQITASGTYWLSAPPMAAALQTLELLEADNSLAMQQMQVGISNHCTALPARMYRTREDPDEGTTPDRHGGLPWHHPQRPREVGQPVMHYTSLHHLG